MTHFKPRDCARVVLSGRTFYLGPWGSREAAQRYDDLIRAWLTHGRSWPAGPQPAPIPPPVLLELTTPPVPTSMEALCELYLPHAEALRGRKTYLNARRALAMLLRSGVAAQCKPADFGPRRLTAFQAWLSGNPTEAWSRTTINEYVAIVVRMFRWGAAHEYVAADAWSRLQAVPGIRRGRAAIAGASPPREGRKVRPPRKGAVEAVRPFLPPVVRAMVDLQLFTGMRPNEVCSLRPADLTPTSIKGVHAYRVRDESNKLEWRGIARIVYIGPRGMAVLAPFLVGGGGRDPELFVFSPREAEAVRMAARRASRTNPMWPSHAPLVRAVRRGQKARTLHERYSPEAYARAVRRACEQCNKARPPATAIEPWYPYQLRHAAASAIVASESLEVAQVLLGHRSIETTLNYVEVKSPRAARAARKLG